MTIKLTATQTTVIKSAAARPDGNIEPLPANLRGGARTAVIDGLLARDLITESHYSDHVEYYPAADGKTNKQGKPFSKQMLYKLMHNRVYLGEIPHKGKSYPGAHDAIIDQALWDAAHAILAENNRQRTSETWQRPQPEALLLGLFYTADGEKYQPAFTKKANGKRYRYYVPNRKVRFGADASPAGRVPAEPVEQMVLAQIHAALKSPEMVQSVWDVTREKSPELSEPEVVLPLRQMGQVWEQLFPAERLRIVQLLIERVTLRDEGIEITWRDAGWATLAGEMRPGIIGAELLELEQLEALA